MVFSLDVPDAEKIKQVHKLKDSFNADYGLADKETPLFEALWLCNHEFKNM